MAQIAMSFFFFFFYEVRVFVKDLEEYSFLRGSNLEILVKRAL